MEKSKVFVIMPFEDDYFESYEMLKSHFHNDFEFSNAGEKDNVQNILADIIQPIFEADIIIADLTKLNANVMYELGVAHALNKKTIVITRDNLENLPFDLKQYRAKNYTTHFKKFNELLEYLDKHLHGAINGEVIFSNPVKDFLDKSKINPESIFSNNEPSLIMNNDDNDKGFLDFLADIETNTAELTKKIESMTSDMADMNNGMEKSTKKIEDVQKTGGNSTATFVRKEARNVARVIETFRNNLHGYNVEFSTLWNRIESNILGLIESKYISNNDNKHNLIEYLKSLYNMKTSITASNESVLGLIESLHDSLGLERSMNQAIRFVEEDLKTYVDTTSQMLASIDRIIEKSKYVVGKIDFNSDIEN